MLRFQVGDKAVYPAQGVAEIVGIEEKEISGKIQRFYCLRILDTDMRILVPVDKAEQVGLRDSILCTAEGLNSELVSGGAPLSQQQRVQLMLARALAARPRLLLIDGLLDRLDPRSRSPLLATLFSPDAPWTLVMVTHRADLLRLCTHTYDLETKILVQAARTA